jgi:prepilin-type N-terminal cleavage/methylation domain-containing protein
MPTGKSQHRSGFTLVEVVIAMVIVAVTSIGFVASVIFSSRQSATNTDHLYAIQLAAKYGAMVRASNFTRLGDTTTSAGAYERQFLSPLTTHVDDQYPNSTTAFTVRVLFSGWGTVRSATPNTLTANLPAGQQPWGAGEWVGHYVVIAKGTGRTQVMRITANTGGTLTVTSDLTGATAGNWTQTPDTTSQFYINNGKTARIAVSWGDGANFRTVNRTVFVRRPSNS